MLKPILLAAVLAATAAAAPGRASTPPESFASVGADRAAIETLLHTYTTAVSTKNEALFESILLNRDIPFSGIGQALAAKGRPHGADNYESFRQGVFHGAPFTQTQKNIHIEQDGDLAQVSLVFVNTSSSGSDWGFKVLQLLKLDGRWKIASEFWTNHA